MNRESFSGVKKIVLLSGFIALLSMFTLHQSQAGLVMRLGSLIKDAKGQPVIYGPGLHFKMPFLDTLKRFDMRLQTFMVNSSRVLTSEQKYVLVDYYVKWRIKDLPLYFKRTAGLSFRAERLLQQRTNGAVRAAFGERTITDVVSGEREAVMGLLRTKANETAKKLGIEVVDVRVKGIDLPEEVSVSVFQRMSADRERVATKHRSDGRSAAEKVRAGADAKVTVMLAQAKAQAAGIRAQGDAQAAAIYNQAFSQDPKFYQFWRSMEAYRTSFGGEQDLLVLDTNNPYFRLWRAEKS